MKMSREQHYLKENHHDEKRNLLFLVQEALNKVIAKRRKEFEKYLLIMQLVGQVHQSEDQHRQPAPQRTPPTAVPRE